MKSEMEQLRESEMLWAMNRKPKLKCPQCGSEEHQLIEHDRPVFECMACGWERLAFQTADGWDVYE